MSLLVLTYPYARGSSSGMAYHLDRSLGGHAFGADVPDPSPSGLSEVDTPDPSLLGSGEVDVPDPIPLESDEVVISFSSPSRWAVSAPSPGGPFCSRLTVQLAQAAYFEGANPSSAS
jgi:hypothetical protein